MNERAWDLFVSERPEANFLQSSAWARANERVGHTVVRGDISRGGNVVAGWQGIVKDARRGRYLEVPGGPLLDWSDTGLAREVIGQLRATAREHRCVFIRLRPQIEDTETARHQLRQLGLHVAPFHLHAEHTNILDLTQPEEALLAHMRRQTRYEVRQAGKKDIQVAWRSDATAVDEFFAVQAETAQRHGFIPPSREFLAAQLEAFGENARIYRAEKDGVLLNLALILFSGSEADYFEAASTPESRGLPGAYAILWQAMRDAKAMAMTRFNFWGIAYTDNPHHRYAGVTTFKRGFGGHDIAYMPAHDSIIRPNRYVMTWIIETIRKKRRKL